MVYGGLIGTEIVRYDLYGTDLMIANKMESEGERGHINISERTKIFLEELETANYTFEPHKKIEVKSKNASNRSIQTYLIRYNEQEGEA